MSSPLKLSQEEISLLQAKAARGEELTLDELRNYVHTTRVSYLAAESKGKQKDRTKKAEVSESQIDFF